MSSIDLEELDDANEARRDFRRANGAPLVSDPNDATKTLRYSRPSSYAKCLDDEVALESWKQWKVMEGVARSKALATQVIASKEEDKEERKKLREKAMEKGQANEKADRGTGLHAMTRRAEDTTDVDFDPPAWVQPDLNAYLDMMAAYGLTSELMELPIVNDTFRAAGTADRLWRLTRPLIAPDGSLLDISTLVIGDLKTGQKLDFSLPGFCVQVALYATGQLYDVVTERRMPTPPIHQRWALLAHMPVEHGRCDLLWIDIDLGLHGARLAQQVKEWRKRWKKGEEPYDAPKVEAPRSVEEHLSEMVADTGPIISIEDMAAFCQRRINVIGSNKEAKAKLILKWPDGLPTPKKGMQTAQQVITLLTLLDSIEAEFSIPFGETDPRLINAKGHKGSTDRSNEFMLEGTKD